MGSYISYVGKVAGCVDNPGVKVRIITMNACVRKIVEAFGDFQTPFFHFVDIGDTGGSRTFHKEIEYINSLKEFLIFFKEEISKSEQPMTKWTPSPEDDSEWKVFDMSLPEIEEMIEEYNIKLRKEEDKEGRNEILAEIHKRLPLWQTAIERERRIFTTMNMFDAKGTCMVCEGYLGSEFHLDKLRRIVDFIDEELNVQVTSVIDVFTPEEGTIDYDFAPFSLPKKYDIVF